MASFRIEAILGTENCTSAGNQRRLTDRVQEFKSSQVKSQTFSGGMENYLRTVFSDLFSLFSNIKKNPH